MRFLQRYTLFFIKPPQKKRFLETVLFVGGMLFFEYVC